MSRRNTPKRLWLPAADWKHPQAQATAPFIRASWVSDAWCSGVEYVRADAATNALHREVAELKRRIRLARKKFYEDDDHAVSRLLDLRKPPPTGRR